VVIAVILTDCKKPELKTYLLPNKFEINMNTKGENKIEKLRISIKRKRTFISDI